MEKEVFLAALEEYRRVYTVVEEGSDDGELEGAKDTDTGDETQQIFEYLTMLKLPPGN